MMLIHLLLLPSGIRLTHHHEHIICKASSAEHIQRAESQCPVCNFEFSSFEPLTLVQSHFKADHDIQTSVILSEFILPGFKHYSYTLRAPPPQVTSMCLSPG